MVEKSKHKRPGRHKIVLTVLCLLTLCAWAQQVKQNPPKFHKPAVKGAQTTPKKVYLEYTDILKFDEEVNPDYQILKGNVRFRKDSMHMYCDSAYFYEKTNSLDAFGNVRMEQGDTLFVYSDVMYYDGNTQIAMLRYNVRLENRDVVLFTDSLNYDMVPNIGYYFDGGKIVDSKNELTSVYGQYSPDTKEAVFHYDVQLINEQYTIYSDTLEYNTNTKIADILGPSVIVSDSNTIYTNLGWYDTQKDESMLLDRSLVITKEQQLTGDTIFYNRTNGFGEAFGNVQINDTLRKVYMEGQYGYYEEKTEFTFVTDSARAVEYSSPDTLYLHGDTLKSFNKEENRILLAYHGVRFFRNDSQGVCDSMEYVVSDSALYMYDDPIIWNSNYQIYGDTIKIYMNDSTIDRVHIPHFAFATQQKDSTMFDQLAGKDLKAYFIDGLLSKVDVSGNVQTIFYPQERDSTITGLNQAESSFLTMFLKDKRMDKLVMWPEVQGSLTPPFLITKNMLYLPDYRWYDYLRPTDKNDIYRKIKKKVSDESTKKRRFSNEFLDD